MPQGKYTDGKRQVMVRLDPALVRRVKIEAAKRSTTVQALVQQGLELVLKTRTA
jgi:predicted HicB family RNase H-like nuclease